MILDTAQNKLIITSFVLIMAVVLFGAAYYKYGLADSSISFLSESEIAFEENPELFEREATLAFTPTGTSQEYQISVQDLTEPVTTIAFQLMSDSSHVINSSNLQIEPSLQQSGWSSSVNNTSNSETGQSFSLLLVRSGVANEVTPEIVLGTLRLATGASLNDLRLNTEESFVTYSTSEEPVRLIKAN